MDRTLEAFASGGYANRRLHLLEVDAPADVAEHAFSFEKHCAVLVAWNDARASEADRQAVAEAILSQGAVSISCWGDGCREAHRVVGETIRGPDPGSSKYPATIITTWHQRESFDEVLWYLLSCSLPDEAFEASCSDTLVITIDEPTHAERARTALRDPVGFCDDVLVAGRD